MPSLHSSVTIKQLEIIECVKNRIDTVEFEKRKGLGSIMKKRFSMMRSRAVPVVTESKDLGDSDKKDKDTKDEMENIEKAFSKQSLKDADQFQSLPPPPTLRE